MKKLLTFIISFCLFISITSVAISQMDKETKDDLYSQIELFSYALTTIQADYVDKLPPKDLIYGSLKGMLSSLDPHSQFLDPEEYKELKTETRGKFGGLGIEISIRDGLLTIITPVEDTPAWREGIKPGDRIVKIEEEVTRNITLSEAVKKLRGKPGTDINITVLRESESKILEFTITREVIHIQDVKYPQILEDNIAYLRLTEFREDSAKEMKKALELLKEDGADSFILDLRNNPGGLLNVAIKISELFLPMDDLIVSTKGRRASQNTETSSNTPDNFADWPIVVLINEGSASGSEIVAGALKDNKRAVIVGAKSFGKGSVQSVIPMPDGSGLRLTTSKYFTPSGESIHEKGIIPDVVIEKIYVDKEEKEEELDDQSKKINEIFDTVVETEEKTTEERLSEREAKARKMILEDNQVQAGMNVIKGIKVYKKITM
jgi:carboxyl-terminal processing protease